MNKLSELKKLLISLTKEEYRELYDGLKIKTSNYNKDTSLKILEIIYNNQRIESVELQLCLYGRNNLNALNKNLSRICEKVYDIYLLKDSIDGNDIYDKRAQDIFMLEKQLIISEILRYRGLFKLSDEKIDHVISLCKYYEHYDILLNALEKKKRWVYPKEDQKFDGKLADEIKIYSLENNLYKNSIDIYYKALKYSYEEFDSKNKRYLLSYLNKVSTNYERSKSNHIKLYFLYIKIQYYRYLLQHKKALELVDQLLEHILNSKNIYSKVRYGNALINKGVFLRYCFNYELSIQFILDSKKYISDQKQNNILIYEQLILTYLYQANYSKVQYYLSIFEKEYLNEELLPVHHNMYNYYKGIIYIINGQFADAYISFNNALLRNEIFLMNMECRILMIISLIESSKLDLADNAIENMRKYYSRFFKNKFNFRSKELALKLLNKLSQSSYDFSLISITEKVILKELEDLLHPFCFHNYEIILFHEWFHAKVKGIPYDHVEVMKRLKKLNKAHL
jgi:hypothetical protein